MMSRLTGSLGLACAFFVLGCSLTASGDEAAALEVWNSSVMLREDLNFGRDKGDPKPIVIVGARNGAFSGTVMIASKKPITGLQGRATDLKNARDRKTIPASAIQVRYSLPSGGGSLPGGWCESDKIDTYPARNFLTFGGLAERPAPVVPVIEEIRMKTPVGRAVQPIWVTVDIPAEAAAGDYEGRLLVAANSQKVEVPVRLTVHGWHLPEPRDFRTFVGMVQSPETLALGYDVPLWSDRHFALVEKSLKLLGSVGDKTTYIHLVGETNHGNANTMVRWIDKGKGKYDYDFEPMRKYLDLVEKHCGKPAVVCFYIWDAWMEGGDHRSLEYWKRIGNTKQLDAWEEKHGGGPVVTVVDPATGATKSVSLPARTTPEGEALRGRFSQALRAEMKKRKLKDCALLGMLGDQAPAPEAMKVLAESMPGVNWTKQSHSMAVSNSSWYGKKTKGWNVKYGAFVWAVKYIHPTKRYYGWKNEEMLVNYPRDTRSSGSILTFRLMGEMNIGGAQRGFGRIGADFWPVVRDKRGRLRGSVLARFPHAFWKNLDLRISMLAPGSCGAVSTRRFEMMREGIQECEARIFIERALTDKALRARLGEPLARQCEAMLTERNVAILKGFNITQPDNWRDVYGWKSGGGKRRPFNEAWYAESWQDLSRKLFTLAGEVEKKLGIRTARKGAGRTPTVASRPAVPKRASKPPARRATRTAAASDLAEMRRVVIDGVKRGRKEQVGLKLGRGSIRGQVVGADEKGITIRTRGGMEMSVPWSSLSAEKLAALAKNYK